MITSTPGYDEARFQSEAELGLVADVVLAHRAEGATKESEVTGKMPKPTGGEPGLRQSGGESSLLRKEAERESQRETELEAKRRELKTLLESVGLRVRVQHSRDGGEVMLKVSTASARCILPRIADACLVAGPR